MEEQSPQLIDSFIVDILGPQTAVRNMSTSNVKIIGSDNPQKQIYTKGMEKYKKNEHTLACLASSFPKSDSSVFSLLFGRSSLPNKCSSLWKKCDNILNVETRIVLLELLKLLINEPNTSILSSA
jgi:hypothetical protein